MISSIHVERPDCSKRYLLIVLFALILVLAVYWPALNAGFVWDDILTFQQRAWLYYGDEWRRYIFTGFNEWTLYFRPLVVAMFVLQVRLFDGDPAGMHAVSLGMHLINVFLIIMAARVMSPRDWRFSAAFSITAGLLYGIHPMLVETVVWIGCQFDQMQVMTMLLGLLATCLVRNRWIRALLVSTLFLMSALSKESAAAFPAIIFLIDWLCRGGDNPRAVERFRKVVKENWLSYFGLFAVGLGYLLLRKYIMGSAISGLTPQMLIPDLARVESVSYVYLKYWQVVAGIPTDLSPLHPVGSVAFGESWLIIICRVTAAIGIVGLGLLALSERFRATGVMVLAVTLYLVPVLGIVPVHFDDSLYHERYAIGAAVLCAVLLPRVVREWSTLVGSLPRLAIIMASFWAIWAVVNVRVTIPLWANNLALWEWAAQKHPDAKFVQANLMGAYIMYGMANDARELVDSSVATNDECAICYVNGLILAVDEGDLALADQMVQKLRDSEAVLGDASTRFLYLRTAAHLELRLGSPDSAVSLLREAQGIERYDAFSYVLLTESLVGVGDLTAATDTAEVAVAMAHPSKRESTRETVEKIIRGEKVYGTPIH